MAALGLLALASVRLLGFDGGRRGNLIATFLPWALLPSYLLLVVGLLARRIPLLALSLIVVVAHIGFVAPELASTRSVSAAAADAPQLRVVTSNVWVGNNRVRDLFDEVTATDPDLVTFHELDASHSNVLRAHPLLTLLPNVHANQHGTVILSRYPILERRTVTIDGRAAPDATIDVDGRSLRVMSVHPSTPLGNHRSWDQALADLTESVAEAPEPLLVLGDFNSTMQHQPFRELLERGNLRDGHNEQGSGWGGTWPTNRPAVNLLGVPLRIDHILANDGAEFISFDHISNTGSDHRGLVADIAVVG